MQRSGQGPGGGGGGISARHSRITLGSFGCGSRFASLRLRPLKNAGLGPGLSSRASQGRADRPHSSVRCRLCRLPRMEDAQHSATHAEGHSSGVAHIKSQDARVGLLSRTTITCILPRLLPGLRGKRGQLNRALAQSKGQGFRHEVRCPGPHGHAPRKCGGTGPGTLGLTTVEPVEPSPYRRPRWGGHTGALQGMGGGGDGTAVSPRITCRSTPPK